MPAQKRVLFYVYDGTGLGHLQRLSRIAGALQGPCACLMITGHRYASVIVPEECEFVHIPSMDSLQLSRSDYWGRQPFWKTRLTQSLALRSGLIDATVNGFNPDALILDFLPIGLTREMQSVLETAPIRKYLTFRGLLHPSIRGQVFEGLAGQLLERCYDRILVTADRSIVDVAAEQNLPAAIADKLQYTGYVVPAIAPEAIASARCRRGAAQWSHWVVCSAGGGKLGDRLIGSCVELARCCPNVAFDIIAGPRNSLALTNDADATGRVRIHQEARDLGLMHAAADLVVCPGGYNSLSEALAGRTPLVISPTQVLPDDEQVLHAQRLKHYYPLTIVTQEEDLYTAVVAALERNPVDQARAAATSLDLNGLATVRQIVYGDLQIEAQ